MSKNFLTSPFRLKVNDRKFYFLLGVVVATIITDIAILRVSVFLTSELYRVPAITAFVLVTIMLLTFQYFILGFAESKTREEGFVLLRAMRLVTVISLYMMIAVAIVFIFQIITSSHFQTILLTIAVAISYSVSIAALSLLTSRFLGWYRSDRNILVLCYGIASAILVLNAIFTLAFALAILNDKNPLVVPHVGVSVRNIPEGSLKAMLAQFYTISSIISFVALWLATTLHLRYYSKRFGRTIYWISLTVPLAYFLTQFVSLFVDIFSPIIEMSPTFVSMTLTIIFTASKPAGGIIFGIAFWIVARKTSSKEVKNYLTIAAYGLVLFFSANQAVVLVSNTFYPPFGIGSVSYVGISSYLILIGIFFSAASVSQDRKILAHLQKSTVEELKLLESMGSSENKERLMDITTRIVKKNQSEMVEASGVESSLGEDEMRDYIKDVISEIESSRRKRNDGKP
jgi:hypothetical protein